MATPDRQIRVPWSTTLLPRYPVRCYQGEDALWTFTALAPTDVTDWSVTFTLSEGYSGPVLLATQAAISDAVNGVLTVPVPSNITSDLATPSLLVWELRRTDSGEDTVLRAGSLSVYAGIVPPTPVPPTPPTPPPASSLLNGLIVPYNLQGDTLASDGSGRDLTAVGSPTFTTGLVGQAIQLVANSSQCLKRLNDPTLRGAPQFTVFCLVKFTAVAGSVPVVCKYVANNHEYALGQNLTGSGLIEFRTNPDGGLTGDDSVQSSYGTFTSGRWYGLFGWVDLANETMAVEVWDCTAQTRTLNTASCRGILPGTSDFNVGAFANSTSFGTAGNVMQVESILLWSRVPNLAERMTLMNGYAGSLYPTFGTPPANTVTLASPTAYQTFQRNGSGQANIAVSGTFQGALTALETRWNGGTWTALSVNVDAGTYSGTLANQPAGQGLLEVRVTGTTATLASAAYVGIGDVFGIWGQSNGCGRGTNYQHYLSPSNGTKATLFGNDYLWHEMADPTDSDADQVDAVSNDFTVGVGHSTGSIWPLVSTSFLTSQGVPVAFVPCALGGSAISQWAAGSSHVDRTTLYGSANYRCQQAGGVKAVLWWQGETDALNNVATATYQAALLAIANNVAADLGCKFMPCKLQTCNITQSQQDKINAAIGNLWALGGNVLTGPDLTGLSTEPEDSVHLKTDAKLASAAALWWATIKAAFGYA